jgi:hypothetical protein
MGKKSKTRSGMNIPDIISESLDIIFDLNLNSLMQIRIRDPDSFRPWIRDGKKIGSGIQDKHPGSATLYF